MKVVDPFYKSARWKRLRNFILRRDKYQCQYAKRYGQLRQATVVHHIFPREEFPDYQYEAWNLISLSAENHNRMHVRSTQELTETGRELMRRTARRRGLE